MFCQNCGKKFESENKLQRYCPECQALKKEEQKQKQKGYAKERIQRLGLVNISIYKQDKEVISNIAKEQNLTIAEALKAILQQYKPKETTKKSKVDTIKKG